MRARLVDVAAKAGVAPNTASMILNNRPDSWASQETRERVFKAATELGYKPSRAARGLRLGQFFTIGLVIPDIHNPFYTTFADLLDKAVSEEKYDLIIEHSRSSLEEEKHCFNTILNRQTDGVAIFVSDTEFHMPYLQNLAARKFPVVALAARNEIPLPIDSILVDFTEGLRQSVDYLIRNNHRRFAFICALAKGQSDGNRTTYLRQMLQDAGIPASSVQFVDCAHDVGSARNACTQLLRNTPRAQRPTAIIALNDLSAIGAIRAARDVGLSVPQDISVLGVDNMPLSEYLPISLTTIAQPIEDMARRTANVLLQRIAGQHPERPSSTLYPTELIVRESTGPAPAV